MPKPTRTNFARISSWGQDGVRMDCEGGPMWVLELAAMQLSDEHLARLIKLLEKQVAQRASAKTTEAA